jgi:hypothetical protein
MISSPTALMLDLFAVFAIERAGDWVALTVTSSFTEMSLTEQ